MSVRIALVVLLCYGLVSTCTGASCGIGRHASPFRVMNSFQKRAPWESNGNRIGLTVADCSELSLPTGAVCSELLHVPADQVHDSSTGVSFVTFVKFQEMMHIRTMKPMAFILKGFVRQKVLAIGIEEPRISQLVLTLRDAVCNSDESRAVTVVNVASDETDFFCKTHDDSALELSDESKLTVYFELRECDASKADWKSYGSVAAFTLYVEALGKSRGHQREDGLEQGSGEVRLLHAQSNDSAFFQRHAFTASPVRTPYKLGPRDGRLIRQSPG